jgi:hypothetical protein
MKNRGPAAAAGTAVLHAEHMKMALTKLVFTFPNSQRTQQFAGWLFLAGYIDRVVEQNTVMVEVAAGKRTVIIKEAAGRGGRLM